MLTVLLPTHNGAGTLPRVLDAYEALVAPVGGWQLVIVDNASTDDTPSVLRQFRERLPLELIRTERRGKNVALNLGIQHLRGELVVLTDDDIVPEADWLVTLSASANANGTYDLVGGTIAPIWPTEKPEWIERLVPLGATYGITGATT